MELTEDEFYDVYLQFNPGVDRDEFHQAWMEFQSLKEARLARRMIN